MLDLSETWIQGASTPHYPPFAAFFFYSVVLLVIWWGICENRPDFGV
jgi:hypothetical protein